MHRNQPPIIVIAGPTGVGKSDLAFAIARERRLEIVSADSRQVYRLLDIGTAKPTLADRALVRHHLVDYVDPHEPYSVVCFRQDADAALGEIWAAGAPALVVGGTNHYIQALVDRIEPPRVPPRPEFRAGLERIARECGVEALHDRLARSDPAAASVIPPTNVRRVIRALEVIAATNRPFTEVGRRRERPLDALRLVLTMPRDALYRKVDERVDRMLAAGWVDEVRELLRRGYSPALPALSSTGYREIVALLRGRSTFPETAQRIKWSTHAYIRRQYVWLRRQPDYTWIEVDAAGIALARELIDRYLTAQNHQRPLE
jgi:tRNA dimethylallyltransferase